MVSCEASSSDGFFTCTFDATIYYTCMQAAEETAFSWGKNNKLSKLSIQLMNSPCFTFTCSKYSDTTIYPSELYIRQKYQVINTIRPTERENNG